MTATVRMFCFRDVSNLPVNPGSGTFSSSGFPVLSYPYSARETLTATPDAPVSSNPITSSVGKPRLARIEVQAGHTVYIEFNPPGRDAVADVNSPTLTGIEAFMFGENWTISVLEQVVV